MHGAQMLSPVDVSLQQPFVVLENLSSLPDGQREMSSVAPDGCIEREFVHAHYLLQERKMDSFKRVLGSVRQG